MIHFSAITKYPESSQREVATSELDQAINRSQLWCLARDWEHVLDLRRWSRIKMHERIAYWGKNDEYIYTDFERHPDFDHPDSIFWSQLFCSKSYLERIQLLQKSFKAELQFLETKAALHRATD